MNTEHLEEWKEQFQIWIDNHGTFMGGIDSNMIPDLKTFIESILTQQHNKTVMECANLASEMDNLSDGVQAIKSLLK